MKKLWIALAVAGIATAALAEDSKVVDETFKKMQVLYATKTVMAQQVKGAEKAIGIGIVLKPADPKQTQASVVWVTPQDPEWGTVQQAFKDAANRQANAAAEELDRYKVTAPPATTPPAAAKK